MRLLVVTALSLFFTSSLAVAQDQDPEPKTFKEAYAGYGKYEEGKTYNEKHLKTHYAQRAYELGRKKFGKDSINTANLMVNWVYSYAEHSNDHNIPTKAFNANIEVYENANKEAPQNIINAYKMMGKSFVKRGDKQDPRKALQFYRKAVSLVDEHFGETSFEQANLHLRIGTELYNNYNTPRTRPYLEKALELYSNNPKTKQIDLAISKFWLAKSLLSGKKTKEASSTMTAALKIFEEEIPSHQYALAGHALMINILEKQGKSDEATKHCQAIGRVTPYTDDQDYLPVYKQQPKYPHNAARKGNEGYVLLEFTVDKEGFVQNLKSVENKGNSSFITASIKAAKKFRYAPRFKDGKPIDTEGVRNLITFEMAN